MFFSFATSKSSTNEHISLFKKRVSADKQTKKIQSGIQQIVNCLCLTLVPQSPGSSLQRQLSLTVSYSSRKDMQEYVHGRLINGPSKMFMS